MDLWWWCKWKAIFGSTHYSFDWNTPNQSSETFYRTTSHGLQGQEVSSDLQWATFANYDSDQKSHISEMYLNLNEINPLSGGCYISEWSGKDRVHSYIQWIQDPTNRDILQWSPVAWKVEFDFFAMLAKLFHIHQATRRCTKIWGTWRGHFTKRSHSLLVSMSWN